MLNSEEQKHGGETKSRAWVSSNAYEQASKDATYVAHFLDLTKETTVRSKSALVCGNKLKQTQTKK